jgi:hypothetical protein
MTGHHHQTHRRRCHPLILVYLIHRDDHPGHPQQASGPPAPTAGKPAFERGTVPVKDKVGKGSGANAHRVWRTIEAKCMMKAKP